MILKFNIKLFKVLFGIYGRIGNLWLVKMLILVSDKFLLNKMSRCIYIILDFFENCFRSAAMSCWNSNSTRRPWARSRCPKELSDRKTTTATSDLKSWPPSKGATIVEKLSSKSWTNLQQSWKWLTVLVNFNSKFRTNLRWRNESWKI